MKRTEVLALALDEIARQWGEIGHEMADYPPVAKLCTALMAQFSAVTAAVRLIMKLGDGESEMDAVEEVRKFLNQ